MTVQIDSTALIQVASCGKKCGKEKLLQVRLLLEIEARCALQPRRNVTTAALPAPAVPGGGKVFSEWQFTVQLSHFIPDFPIVSVARFLKRQSDITLGGGGIGAAAGAEPLGWLEWHSAAAAAVTSAASGPERQE